MDWADDVAYSVHDLEDGLHAGLITLTALDDPAERNAVAKLTAAEYCAPGSVTEAELAEVFAGLLALPCWPAGFDAGLYGLAALKNLTSELIGRLCGAAQAATLAASGGQPVTRYAADLVVPRRQRLECALLKGVTAHYVMSRAGAAEAQARERELITELAAAVRIGAPGTLDPGAAAGLRGRQHGRGPAARRGRPGRLAHRYFRYRLARPAVPLTWYSC